MRDVISKQRVLLLHPVIKTETIALIEKVENNFPETVKIRIVQALRTIEEQNALFALGRTRSGHIVTNAKGGSSFHNYGLAIDFAIMYDENGDGNFETLSWDLNRDFDHNQNKDWQEVVEVFKTSGWEWGGDWHSIKDNPHLQKAFGYTWQQLFAKYNLKDFLPNTEYVRL